MRGGDAACSQMTEQSCYQYYCYCYFTLLFVITVCCSRWVRLLFGREFPMQDLLMLWDAIFADSISFDLVDYVFVAMLLYIRDAS